MSMDPDKDMLALPAEAELGGPKMPPAPRLNVTLILGQPGAEERRGHV
jgi:hypothetical protein